MKPVLDVIRNNNRAYMEHEKQLRDDEVQRLRGEMKLLHDALEPHWEREQAASGGPVNLRQTVVTLGK